MTKDVLRRIYWRVSVNQQTGCWVWQGSVKNGYGEIRLMRPKRHNAYVHRVMFEHYHRPLLDGELVMHVCDLKLCCNPRHLQAGTKQTNAVDAVVKGRPMGASRTRITPDIVQSVRERHVSGETIAGLHRATGLARPTVTKIVRRQQAS